MRSSMMADVLRDLAERLGDTLNKFEPSASDICDVFHALGVQFDRDKIETDGYEFLLHGTLGMSATFACFSLLSVYGTAQCMDP